MSEKEDFEAGKVTTRIIAQPPADLLTDGGYGDNRRLRVDVAQTGFFAGREFRSFYEFSIAAGASLVVRATLPINIILFEQGLTVDAGEIRYSARVGGTPGGTFSNALPIINKNAMTTTPAYTPVVALHTGGTHTGGTTIDVARVHAANQQNAAVTVGGVVSDERGIAPGTYYLVLENTSGTDTATGVWRGWWEERP